MPTRTISLLIQWLIPLLKHAEIIIIIIIIFFFFIWSTHMYKLTNL